MIGGKICGDEILVGSRDFLAGRSVQMKWQESNNAGSEISVARRGQFLGNLVISERLRSEARRAVQSLKSMGLRTVLLSKLVETLRIARRCRRTILQNFVGTLGVDGIGIGLAAFGLLNPLLAAFIHVSSEMAFILNSARLVPRRSLAGAITRLSPFVGEHSLEKTRPDEASGPARN
jgi:cation transport ATPase